MPAALVALIVAVGSVQYAAAAPRFICYTVRPGDTAAGIALRLTGDAQSRHDLRFQIFDPAVSRFIPKAHYRRIQPGWRACIAEAPVAPISAQGQGTGGEQTKRVGGMVFGLRWFWMLLLFSATMLVWILAQTYSDRRHATFQTLERFGSTFVREFERPLIQERRPGSPLRSRLRILPRQERLEVLLAPNEGRSYPNLSEHRKNVEYDVGRVMTLLGDRRFVRGQLGARGSWVVIPFRLEPRLSEEGAA